MTRSNTYYGDYLQLEKFLNSQQTVSSLAGDEKHDEMLFIIVHQAYELWFKQILHELRSAMQTFAQQTVAEKDIPLIVARLERIKKIQDLLLLQLPVLETMTPMDFLEFRDLLVPASGFQSVQFREIEIILGLRAQHRSPMDRKYFMGRLSQPDRNYLEDIEKQPSLLNRMETWLERLPFTLSDNFDFWREYREAVNEMLDKDEKIIQEFSTGAELEGQIENLKSTRSTFTSLFDEKSFAQLHKEGSRRLSQKAMMNALFIFLYRDEPILNQPFQLLTALKDIDEKFTTWRYRHAIMVQGMLGTKIGTGGSSGHDYLKRAAENNRVFLDLCNLSTFLIPRNKLPRLPEALQKKMGFRFGE